MLKATEFGKRSTPPAKINHPRIEESFVDPGLEGAYPVAPSEIAPRLDLTNEEICLELFALRQEVEQLRCSIQTAGEN